MDNGSNTDDTDRIANIISVTKNYISDLVHDNKETYFLTITLKPYLYKFGSITQFELTQLTVANLLYKATKDFIMVAEHTQSGNIHYHIVLAFSSSLQRILLVNTLKKNRMIGFIKLDPQPVREALKVMEYMTKDLYTTLKAVPFYLRWRIAYNLIDHKYVNSN